MSTAPKTRAMPLRDAPAPEYMIVTPDYATKLLEENKYNRPLSQATVDAYAADMRRGVWRANNQGIAIGPNGELFDGQHRLWAIVESGVSVPMLIVHGVTEEARATIDGGRVRRAADQMSLLSSVRYASCVVGWYNAHNYILNPAFRGRNSYAAVMEWMDKNLKAVEWGQEFIGSMKGRTFGSAPVLGALVFAFPTDPTGIKTFATCLAAGEDLRAKEPVHTLRQYLLESLRGKTDDRRAVSVKVLRSLQLQLAGKTLVKVQYSEEGVAYFSKYHLKRAAKQATQGG